MKDVTRHNKEAHATLPIAIPTHTRKWYELFGDKCPVCGAEAAFK